MTTRYEIKDVGIISWHENEIRVLIVEEQHKRRGYGKLLLNEAEKEIKKRYSTCYLLAFPIDNSISKDELFTFYKKNGYTQFSWFERFWYRVSPNTMKKKL
jgi:GNAT superfamily N-acetyltransferase